MDDKEREKSVLDVNFWVVVGFMVLVIIGGSIAFTMVGSHYEEVLDKTRSEIDDRVVSDEYRQGWIDALDRLDEWYRAPVNTTMGV